MSKYYASFCLEGDNIAYKSLMSFPQMTPTDDAEKSTASHKVLTCSKQCLHITKRENLTESIGMVPAKYPPNVKLELFTILECQNLGKLCVPWLVRVLGLL